MLCAGSAPARSLGCLGCTFSQGPWAVGPSVAVSHRSPCLSSPFVASSGFCHAATEVALGLEQWLGPKAVGTDLVCSLWLLDGQGVGMLG